MAVTIGDVAREAQVSASTVSRVFTMPELVREATRNHVLGVAGSLGYQPNRAARGLITGKTQNIGLIMPDLANPFFPSVLKGAQARAHEADHAIFVADTDENPQSELNLIRTMSKQVDGVVVCSSRMSARQIEEIKGTTSLVFLNRRVPGIPATVINSGHGVGQAVDHLAALGHRRVAYLEGPRTSWSNRERLRGLRTAVRKRGLEVVTLGPFSPYFEAGLQAADQALAADVSAVLAYNDLMALGVLTRMADRGVAVPAEMSVIGVDDIDMAQMSTPPLTTVAMPKQRAGRVAVELLLTVLAAERVDGRLRRDLDTQLIIRSSTAPPASEVIQTPVGTGAAETGR